MALHDEVHARCSAMSDVADDDGPHEIGSLHSDHVEVWWHHTEIAKHKRYPKAPHGNHCFHVLTPQFSHRLFQLMMCCR